MAQVRAHIIVQGVVQGVGYRFFAIRTANELSLSGYTRNLRNGDVEVEAEGERGLIEELVTELRVGPGAASVENVFVEWKEFQGDLKGFDVKF